MQSMSTNDAKAQFRRLLDTARHEPVMIQQIGRPVAVVISVDEYERMEAVKLERLRAELQIGVDQIERGEFVEFDEADAGDVAERIKARGRAKAVHE